MIITGIQAMASTCSTKADAVTICATIIVDIGARSDIIGTAKTAGADVMAGDMKAADAIIQETQHPARSAGPNVMVAGRGMAMTVVDAVKVGVAATINGAVATAMAPQLFQFPIPKSCSVPAAAVAKALAVPSVVAMMVPMPFRSSRRTNPACARAAEAIGCVAAAKAVAFVSPLLNRNRRLERNLRLLLHRRHLLLGPNGRRLLSAEGVRQMNAFANNKA